MSDTEGLDHFDGLSRDTFPSTAALYIEDGAYATGENGLRARLIATYEKAGSLGLLGIQLDLLDEITGEEDTQLSEEVLEDSLGEIKLWRRDAESEIDARVPVVEQGLDNAWAQYFQPSVHALHELTEAVNSPLVEKFDKALVGRLKVNDEVIDNALAVLEEDVPHVVTLFNRRQREIAEELRQPPKLSWRMRATARRLINDATWMATGVRLLG